MRRVLATALLAACAVACAPTDGLVERYRLEQKLWKAQFYQRRINISFMRASRKDTQLAIAAFHRVLAVDPLASPRAASWDEELIADIRRIQVGARVALANLYFLSERFVDAGTMYRQTLAVGELSLEQSLEARLGAARSTYLAGETGESMEQCAAIFRELSHNPVFVGGENEIDAVFLNVPVALVRMYHESGDSRRATEFAQLALEFYDRLAGGGGAGGHTLEARLAALQVCLAVRDWPAAVARFDAAIGDPSLDAVSRAGLELLLAEVHAFPLRDAARAEPILERVASGGSGYGYAARFDLGALQAQTGNEEAAIRIFRELELDRATPAAVASRAMFARARIYEQRGDWDQAYTLFRRVEQIHPFTLAAIEAPLVVTRHYVATGEAALARRTLDRARNYYLSLLDRGSGFQGDRLLVQAALAESFLAAGETADVAGLLAAGSPRWDATSAAAGMLRSAELYETVLGDREQASTLLKKCIERFPETRYANMALRRLEALEGRSR